MYPSLLGVEADVLEVVPQGEDGEVGGADDGAGVEVDARQRHRLVDPACLNKHERVDCWHFKYYPYTLTAGRDGCSRPSYLIK